MTLPTITRAQLEPLLERVLSYAKDDAPLILVRGNPETAPSGLAPSGRSVDLLATSSPLEIRARASKPRNQPLVVLTGCDASSLGDDLVARAVRHKLHTVDRWETVSQLFGADTVSRSLSEHRELADALIEAKPMGGYPRVTTKVLDLDTALDALVHSHLGVQAESLAQLLTWGTTPAAARVVRDTPDAVLTQLERHLCIQFGPGAAVVFAALRAGQASDLMPLALAADVIHAVDDPAPEPKLRLELLLGEPGLDATAYRNIGAAAVERVWSLHTDQQAIASWLAGADRFVSQWKATDEVWRSSVLPSAFTQRTERAARALDAWRQQPESKSLAAAADAAVAQVGEHRHALDEPQRVGRLQMAARMIRRDSADLAPAGTLGEAIIGYTSDGAWLDRARVAVSQGDTEPTAAALFAALTAEADAARIAQGEQIARIVAGAAQPLSDELLGIEAVLTQVVAPLAATVPVLVVVLDGMGWPTFTEVLERLEHHAWSAYADPAGVAARPVLAALPTVTEFSRTSLLCGTLRQGDKESERRGFTKHEALLAVSSKAAPPVLFHKTDLRAGGLDTIPAEALTLIRDERVKVVGVVLNNIDERLKDVANPPTGWGLDELAPLREILEAARSAGRAVVLTADHGHVLERGTEFRTSGGGGERWRAVTSGPVTHGEIEARGPRVVTEDKAAILPWLEQLRYGGSRNGYHGGITMAEAVVPLAVLSTEDIEGWSPRTISPPAWWQPAFDDETPTPTAPAAKPSNSPTKTATTPSLFDPEPEVAEPTSATSVGAEIERIMATEHVRGQLSSLRLDAAVVTSILGVLNRAGGTALADTRIADAVDIPRQRIGRVITQMQRLLNIDGYPVINTVNGEVKFDRALLERQLGL